MEFIYQPELLHTLEKGLSKDYPSPPIPHIAVSIQRKQEVSSYIRMNLNLHSKDKEPNKLGTAMGNISCVQNFKY